MEEIKTLVGSCNDIITLRGVIGGLLDSMKSGLMFDCDVFETLKIICNELSEPHITEGMAKYYYNSQELSDKILNLAKSSYEEIKTSYSDVTLGDWLVLYGRMSVNNSDNSKIVEACKVFLDNNFAPFWDIKAS